MRNAGYKEAYQAARLSRMAYQPDDSIRLLGSVVIDSAQDNAIPYLGTVKFFVWYDTAGTVRRQYLVIRGTSNLQNALRDLQYPKTFDRELQTWVHAGFSIAAALVMERSKDLLRGDLETVVTGHSLGGAAALIVFAHLYHRGARLGPLYTFGQPKALCEGGTLALRCLPVVRFANEHDPVPFVPPTVKPPADTTVALEPGLHGAFRHVGDEVILRAQGAPLYLLNHDQYRNGIAYAAHAVELLRRKDYAAAVKEHDAALYVERIWLLAE